MRQTLIDTLKTHLPLDLHARTLDETQVWELVLYASVQGLSLDSACQTLADVPSGNRVREHLKEAFDASAFSVLAVEEELNAALAQGLSPALTKRINRKRYDIGIDLVEIPYYGQPAQIDEEIRRGQARSGTTRFHAYATFVWADETMDQIVDRLLRQAKTIGLRIRRAYLDKGFARPAVFTLLRQKRIPYLIPLPIKGKTGGLKALCQGKASYRTRHTFNVGTSRGPIPPTSSSCVDTIKDAMAATAASGLPMPPMAWSAYPWHRSLPSIDAASVWRVAIGRCIRSAPGPPPPIPPGGCCW